MSVTRTYMARGTKLTKQHVFTPIADTALVLTGNVGIADISPVVKALKEDEGTFQIEYDIPMLDGHCLATYVPYSSDVNEYGDLMLSFILVPPQDSFRATVPRVPTGREPTFILDEVHISFDQRDEPAVICGVDHANDGYLDFANTDDYDLTFLLRTATKDVLSFSVPSLEFMSPIRKNNPCVWKGSRILLQPYEVYTVVVGAPEIAGTTTFASFKLSLHFKTNLIVRDKLSVQPELQNMPTKHGGEIIPPQPTDTPNLVVTQPAVGAIIEADTAAGVQKALNVLDQAALGKFAGGYTKQSEASPRAHIVHDACYDIIAVPMFNYGYDVTSADNAGAAIDNRRRLPYLEAAPPYKHPTGDRRIIRIDYPFVLHHVIALFNAACVPIGGGRPIGNVATFLTSIGVSIVSGLRGDLRAYQQVAALLDFPGDELENGVSPFIVGSAKHLLRGHMHTGDWDQRLLHVPLVYPAALTHRGISYNTQGTPIYIGSSWSHTDARTQTAPGIGIGVMQAPSTLGQEQFIMVEWVFGDAAVGLGNPGTTFVGHGGHWVYLIGKKQLATVE